MRKEVDVTSARRVRGIYDAIAVTVGLIIAISLIAHSYSDPVAYGTFRTQNLIVDNTALLSGGFTSGANATMGTHLLNDVVDPVSAQDAATKHYVDTSTTGAVVGTSNTIAKFTGTNAVGNASFTDNGSAVTFSTAISLGSHLINAVTDPVSAQDAATKNYVDTHIGSIVNRNPFAGIGADGTCNFDGVTSPVCGATLSGSTYTMLRTVQATNSTVANGVTVLVAGYPFNATQTITGGGATAKISGAGNPGSGTTAGARSTVGSTFFAMSSNAGGAGGAAGASAIGGNGQTQGVAINEWPSCTTSRNQNATSFGCGGGGGDGGGGAFGGAGGASTPTGAARGGSTVQTLENGRDVSTNNLYSAGAGGGGGASGNTNCTGGGGGGGGAWVVVNAGAFAGTLTVTAAGGNGANAGAGTDGCGGGGGGAGGVVIVTYETASGLTTTAAGGTGGTQTNTGIHGGNGFQGTVFRLNLSGDGT